VAVKRRALTLVSLATLLVLPPLWPQPASATTPVITASATPAAISPNGDGVQDSTTITVTVDQPVTLDVVVRDQSSTAVATLLAPQAVSAGTQTLQWNGSGLADGAYTVVASANDGATTTQATTPVTIDTIAPAIDWKSISPEPVISTNPVHFEFHASDPGVGQLGETLTIYDHAGSLDDQTFSKDQGDTTLNWTPKYGGGQPVVDGLYGARVKVTDAAGNSASSDREPFRVLRSSNSKVFYGLTGVGDRMALSFDDCNDSGAWKKILNISENTNFSGYT
jgi:flagellar hook assembly protein FlgD